MKAYKTWLFRELNYQGMYLSLWKKGDIKDEYGWDEHLKF